MVRGWGEQEGTVKPCSCGEFSQMDLPNLKKGETICGVVEGSRGSSGERRHWDEEY